ncbi:MAG TPA: YjbH domain-containing protein [Verrucomicrobiae bacterium]|nr:YjbH domain-containing protein [Verrucomicrobiae bacterium]
MALAALGNGPVRADLALNGATGYLVVPSAEVQHIGTAAAGWSLHNPRAGVFNDIQNYYLQLGFSPNFEFAGRVAESGEAGAGGIRDLSLNAKYRVDLPWGIGVAFGAMDIGGEARNLRSTYAVATLPWRTLQFSAGFGVGPDVLDGAFGGLEWRPWPLLGLVAEHDAENANAGLKLASPELAWGLRLGATATWRKQTEEAEFGAQLSFPLGRSASTFSASSAPASSAPDPVPASVAPENRVPSYPALRSALLSLGFELIRIGERSGTVLVVGLENRVYNHSSADVVGAALAAMSRHGAPGLEILELHLHQYGVPQVTITAPAALYRAFLDSPGAHLLALREALVARQAAPSATPAPGERSVVWEPVASESRTNVEIVIEPVLRTFVATESGLLDAGLGARGRATVFLTRGLLLNAGLQVPLVATDDFHDGGNFEGFAPEAALDVLQLQFLHKTGPGWSWLWSVGRQRIFQADWSALGLEQAWLSHEGDHQLRAKLLSLHGIDNSRIVALAGYTWFDAARDYSIGLTGGRFYSADTGARVDLSRYFGDTIATVFARAGSLDDIAAGVQLSLPLTPRRDAAPSTWQVKGSRRWGHGVSTTVHTADGSNALRPLFLFEPASDLDLRRDFLDSGRLGQDYLRDELPRMHEAALGL